MSVLSSIFGKKWTLADMMRVDMSRQQKSGGCVVSFIEAHPEVEMEGIIDKFKRFFTRNKAVMNVLYVIFKFNVSSETGHSYTVFIKTEYDPQGRLYMNNPAQIYCECQDFKFSSAWTLNQHSALFRTDSIDLGLGPALSNAPKRTPRTVLCKHAYAAVNYLINNYTYLMRNV